jgi:hypothetical protein
MTGNMKHLPNMALNMYTFVPNRVIASDYQGENLNDS